MRSQASFQQTDTSTIHYNTVNQLSHFHHRLKSYAKKQSSERVRLTEMFPLFCKNQGIYFGPGNSSGMRSNIILCHLSFTRKVHFSLCKNQKIKPLSEIFVSHACIWETFFSCIYVKHVTRLSLLNKQLFSVLI